jgi:hypothetical protein
VEILVLPKVTRLDESDRGEVPEGEITIGRLRYV